MTDSPLLTQNDLIIKERIKQRRNKNWHIRQRSLFTSWRMFWDMVTYRPEEPIPFKGERLKKPASCPRCKELFWVTCNECPYCDLDFNGDLTEYV